MTGVVATPVTVAVIAKECRPGLVKTRLHPPLSLEQAADVAAASLHDTLQVVRALPADRRVLFFEGHAADAVRDGFEVLPQPSGGLDERLGALFDAVDGPLLLVGMDTPQITAAAVAPFFDGVATAAGSRVTAWFGPALDGGFWALGLTAAAPGRRRGDLIRGVPMSRDDTGAVQRRRLVEAGCDVVDLPALRDIDTIDDLTAVRDAHPHLTTAAAARAVPA
ncbi:DUF2064 domain-containing protein [Schumannella sp. 10F1B-5-1]|uniref:TIGR04282 family arsenosugar biosynthesis glycosyltransferase n=1 Tax=Schumannella sp. 10F1B-5-1 TaxID=2590780 RepID=UPI00113001C2|nr:DUF2064 domain-containing protein [Schumannella sp. 10F1B-5-1]TPW72823.1 DUF2064 domain-containing protein [Schumannella sp. 10F1B-5-1]